MSQPSFPPARKGTTGLCSSFLPVISAAASLLCHLERAQRVERSAYDTSIEQQMSRQARHDNLRPPTLPSRPYPSHLVILSVASGEVESSVYDTSKGCRCLDKLDMTRRDNHIFLFFVKLFLFSTSFSLYMLHLRLREFLFSPSRDPAGEKYREFHWKEC